MMATEEVALAVRRESKLYCVYAAEGEMTTESGVGCINS